MKFILTLSFCLNIAIVFANTQSDMRKVLDNFIKLLPYTNNGIEIKKKPILAALKNIEESLDNSKHKLLQTSPTFSSNFKFLKENIGHIRKGLKFKHNFYAKSQIKDLVSNCISCHSQLPNNLFKKISHNYKNEIKENLNDTISQALFHYFLRDYDGAIKVLDKTMNKVQSPREKRKLILLSLKMYLTHLKDYKQALNYLATLSYSNKNEIDLWQAQIKEWNKNSKLSAKTLINLYLNPIEDELLVGNRIEKEVILFLMEGFLQDQIYNAKDKTIASQGLYWLGLIENSAPTLYSLGDHYLKDCIQRYPKTNYAKKAYTAYEKSTIFGFSGSSGTHIPEDIKEEMKMLKKLIEGN